MNAIAVAAVQDFDLDGRRISRGQEFAVSAVQASILVRQHKVRLLPKGTQTRDLTTEEMSTRKRRYRRRDMVPE